jgi:hypothetical protein
VKTLYVGDLHGKFQFLKFIREYYREHRKILIGDYVDAFPHEATRAEQVETLRIALEMAEEGNTIALMGNHEFGYLDKGFQCSGYTNNMQNELNWHGYIPRMWKNLKLYEYDIQNAILATHAGLTQYIFTEYKLTLDTLTTTFFDWTRDPHRVQPLYWIGKGRGGHDVVGGPLWCHWPGEFRPIEGLTQIFGHTAVPGIQKLGTNYNIDCLGYTKEVLEFDDKTNVFTIMDLTAQYETYLTKQKQGEVK